MAIGPLLTGCSQQAASTGATDASATLEDEGKEEAALSENDMNTIGVIYETQGNYTVTIKESDLVKLDSESNNTGAPSGDDDEGKSMEEEDLPDVEEDAAANGTPEEANAETNDADPEQPASEEEKNDSESSDDEAQKEEQEREAREREELDKKYAEEGKEGYIYKGLIGDEPQWEPIEFTVLYEGDLESPINSEIATYETPLTLPEPAEREGHTFLGWATFDDKPEDAASDPSYHLFPAGTVFEHDLTCSLDGGEVKLIDFANESEEIRLYAQWDDEAESNDESDDDTEYTVVYGGELAKPIDSEVVTAKTELTLPEPDAREGYIFVGWATAKDQPAEGEKTNPEYRVFPAGTKFDRNLSCAYDLNDDGSVEEDEEVKLTDYADSEYDIKLYAQWDEDAKKAEAVKFSDIKEEDVHIVYGFEPITEDGDEASEPETREAKITGFKNENDAITLSFTDSDAAVNDTDLYYVLFNGLNAFAVIEPDFKDCLLTSDTESVSCDSDDHTITLTVDGAEFEENVSTSDITLGGSFKEMQVAEVSPAGTTLTLRLTGRPVLESDVSTTYTAGQISVAEEAFKGGAESETAYVDVEIPAAYFDVEEIEARDKSVTIPLYVPGTEADEITASDVSFESGAQVTDVKADGDKLQVTVATDNVGELTGKVKVKDQEFQSPVTHAVFDADLENVEAKDDELQLTLALTAEDGTFAEGLSAESVSLADDFADGKVTSVEAQDETNAEVTISVPANGKTVDDYDLVGTVTLAEGALVDEWGTAAPEYSHATYYAGANAKAKAKTKTKSTKKAEAQKKKQQQKEEEEQQRKQDKVDRGQKVVDYGVEALNFVGGDAAIVGAYCLDIFKIASSAYMGDIGGVASAIGSIIKRAGLLEGGEDPNAPTAQSVEEKMDELKDLMSSMDQRMDVLEKNQYDMLVRGFDNALDALSTDCSRAESMLRGAKEIYVQQGKTVPSENASQEELLAYNHDLIDIIEQQEKSGDRAFKNYSSLIARIENNYITATTEAKKDWNYNPFHYYDKRVATYFNWETQGWYMRETYRTFAKFQITRAYSTLSLYYEIPQNAERYKDITTRFAKSLQTIEDHPAGLSPTDWREGTAVYSNTLKRSISDFGTSDTNKSSNTVSDAQVTAYTARLHGKSVREDLELAFPAEKATFDTVPNTGVGMGGKWTKSKVRLRTDVALLFDKYLKLNVGGPKTGSLVKFGKEKIYFERILYWNGDFKSVKTQDKGEKISVKFLIMQ